MSQWQKSQFYPIISHLSQSVSVHCNQCNAIWLRVFLIISCDGGLSNCYELVQRSCNLNCNWTILSNWSILNKILPWNMIENKHQNYDKTIFYTVDVCPKNTILHVYTVNACTEAQQFCNQAPWCCCRASCWDRSDGVTCVIVIMHCRFNVL